MKTNTPNIQAMDNSMHGCQCEIEEKNDPLLPFQSNNAIKFHQNYAMRGTSVALAIQKEY